MDRLARILRGSSIRYIGGLKSAIASQIRPRTLPRISFMTTPEPPSDVDSLAGIAACFDSLAGRWYDRRPAYCCVGRSQSSLQEPSHSLENPLQQQRQPI